VTLPGDADVDALIARLAAVADELGVRATLQPADSDVL
jgi:predicted ArsR family transcriptional regulator